MLKERTHIEPIREANAPFLHAMQQAVGELSGDQQNEAFVRAMTGKCQEASHALVYHLLHTPDIFSNVAIIACHNSPKEHFTGWLSHYGVLAQDDRGMWYASSPANYRTDDITEKFHVGSLEEVLNAYTNRESGLWVDPAFVQETVTMGRYVTEAVMQPDGAAHIQTVCMETDGRYRDTPFFQRARPYVFDVGPSF